MFASGCSTRHITETSPLEIDPSQSEGTIQQARESLDKEAFKDVIDVLLPFVGNHSTQEFEAESHYLVGKAYFHLAKTNISQYRNDLSVGMGELPPEAVEYLTKSRFHLERAGDTAPNGPYAAESFYLAGLSMDYGYLQEFKRALEVYRWTMKAYPNTEFGRLSKERYEEINENIKSIEGTSH